MFGANQQLGNPMISQFQKMQTIQSQISGPTLTNQGKQGQGKTVDQNKDLTSKSGLPWKRYCWLCSCSLYWGHIAQIKRKVMQMMQASSTKWAEAAKNACETSRDQ